MSERTPSRPDAPTTVGALEETDWAPLGWTSADTGWVDDAPFGSVLGDPLMGSLLFDEAAVAEERARRVASYGVSPSGTGFTATDDAASQVTERLRAEMERQQRALSQRVAPQRTAPGAAVAPYGLPPQVRAPGVVQDPYTARRAAVPAQQGKRPASSPAAQRSPGKGAGARGNRPRQERNRGGSKARTSGSAGSAIVWGVIILYILIKGFVL